MQRVAALALCSQVALLSAFDAGRAHAATAGLEAVFADGFEYGNECAWAIPDTCEQGLVTVSLVAVEEGSQFELAVHLVRAPLSPALEVTATIVDADGAAAVSGPLTFAPGNFGVDQSFTVTGLEDLDLDDTSGSAQVVLSVTSAQGSTPPEGVPDLVLPLKVTDDDSQEIVLSWAAPAPFVNSVQEEGPPGTVRVHLAHPPRGGLDDVVQLVLESILLGHAAILSPPTLTFNTSNFAVDQLVSFRALLDGPPAIHETGNIVLFLDESADPAGPNPNVIDFAPIRLIDRDVDSLATETVPGFLGGTELTERTNIAWGLDSALITGHSAGGIYTVAREDRDLSAFTAGPAVTSAAPDGTTQVIEWSGTAFGVFATEGTEIRYTEVPPDLTLGATSVFGVGNRQFSVTRNSESNRYGVIYRTGNDNLEFVHVEDDATVGPPVLVTSVDASPDLAPAVHFVGSAFVFDFLPTPYVALYTAGGGGLTCVRLSAGGAPVPGGSATLDSSASLSASVFAGNFLAVARHDASGLRLQAFSLTASSSLPACELLGAIPLRGADTYIHPPTVAWNGVEFAVAYDVQHLAPGTGAPVRLVGVAVWNPMGAPTNRLFDGPADVPGERPSITWAGDRWILRYSSPSGVRLLAGSMRPVP